MQTYLVEQSKNAEGIALDQIQAGLVVPVVYERPLQTLGGVFLLRRDSGYSAAEGTRAQTTATLMRLLFNKLIPGSSEAQLLFSGNLEGKNHKWGYSTPGSFWVCSNRSSWNNLFKMYQRAAGLLYRANGLRSHQASPGCGEVWPEGQGMHKTPSAGWGTAVTNHSVPDLVLTGLCLKQSLTQKEVEKDTDCNHLYNIYAELQNKLSGMFNRHRVWPVTLKVSCQKLAQHSHQWWLSGLGQGQNKSGKRAGSN